MVSVPPPYFQRTASITWICLAYGETWIKRLLFSKCGLSKGEAGLMRKWLQVLKEQKSCLYLEIVGMCMLCVCFTGTSNRARNLCLVSSGGEQDCEHHSDHHDDLETRAPSAVFQYCITLRWACSKGTETRFLPNVFSLTVNLDLIWFRKIKGTSTSSILEQGCTYKPKRCIGTFSIWWYPPQGDAN